MFTVLSTGAGSAEIKLTSGLQATGALRKTTAGARILPLSQCPQDDKCSTASAVSNAINDATPAAPSATADEPSSPAAGNAAATTVPTPALAPVPATAQRTTVINNVTTTPRPRMCPPSQLGYQCSHQLAPGVVLHHSRGGPQPDNSCTNGTSLNRQLLGPPENWLHFAIQSNQEVMFCQKASI